MATTEKIQPQDSSLKYKIQDPFFIDYYKLRGKAITAKSRMLRGDKEPIITALYEFLDYSSDYVFDYDKKIEVIEKLLVEYEDMELKEFREKVNDFWREINSDHVKFEILPKPDSDNEDIELENFWKGEKHKGVKELKKVVSDVFKFSS